MKEDIFTVIRPMIAKRLRCPEERIVLEADFRKDLGADSIDLVELVMTIESHYDVEFSDETIASILTVGDAVDYLITVVSA